MSKTSLLGLSLSVFLMAGTQPTRAAGFSADNYPPQLQQQLLSTLEARDKKHFRTKNLDDDGKPLYTNRLLLADSPYLQQHAHNPVDWHPWNADTRAKAKALGKPIFLSIGYATCHWCHVMEEESFDNPEIATLINQLYLPVKVDRESQPSVDRAYMSAVQRMTGQGGWPLNVLLSPEGYPLLGGTYFPPDMFKRVLERTHTLYQQDTETLTRKAEVFWQAVHKDTRLSAQAQQLDPATLDRATELFAENMDELQGGFGHAPKFPQETRLLYLLDENARHPNPELTDKLRTTLDQMARGALFDQLGGGFHRYTVDNNWHEPHYEKMLYNQASMLLVYLRAWEQFGEPDYARVVHLTAQYLLRDMRDDTGLFYAATDADSEGIEGLFFTWTPELLKQELGDFKAQRLLAHYTIATPLSGGERGPLVVQENADFIGPPPEVDALREYLRQKREARVPPLTDHKLITGWNARAITALAQAGHSMRVPAWQQAAEAALDTLWKLSYRPGRPLARYTIDSKPSGEGTLDDYAALLEALMITYRHTGTEKWLERATALGELTLVLFRDRESGVFYDTRAGASDGLGFRSRSRGDDPMPDSTGTTLHALDLLFHATGERQWESAADGILATQASELTESPWRWAWLLHQWRNQRDGEISPSQWAANGQVSINAHRDGGDIVVKLNIAKGWHLQSAKPSHPDLIATKLYLNDGTAVSAKARPGAEMVATGIKNTPMSLYSGAQTLLVDTSDSAGPISLRLQACDDKLCLPPETVQLGYLR